MFFSTGGFWQITLGDCVEPLTAVVTVVFIQRMMDRSARASSAASDAILAEVLLIRKDVEAYRRIVLGCSKGAATKEVEDEVLSLGLALRHHAYFLSCEGKSLRAVKRDDFLQFSSSLKELHSFVARRPSLRTSGGLYLSANDVKAFDMIFYNLRRNQFKLMVSLSG
jgi:hypothetical protein